jgi:transposase
MHLVDGVPKKEVARRLGLDVKTVRRALQGSGAPPKRHSLRRLRRLDACRDAIVQLLKEEPRISAKRIGVLLGERAGGIRPRGLRRYVAEVRGELQPKEAFVHRTHRPGDTMEADFFEGWVEIAGVRHKARFLIAALPCCNAYFAKAYPIERLESWLDGLNSAFAWFGGVSARLVLDNTKIAVKRILGTIEREETQAFHAWRGSFPLHVDFCAPAKGWEKGSVERGVEYVRGVGLRPIPKAANWDELNAMLLRELDADLDRRRLPDGRTARQALASEREHLRPLPAWLPDAARVVSCVADKYAIVRLAGVRYSVPSELCRRALTTKLYWDRVEVFDGARRVATHSRRFGEGETALDPLHVLALLEKKHRAVSESTAIQQWDLPAVFHRLRDELRSRVRKSDREWVRVLRLLEHHALPELTLAVEVALERGSPTLETIRMLLRQGAAGELEVRPAQVADERLASIEISAPRLSSYDELSEVAR